MCKTCILTNGTKGFLLHTFDFGSVYLHSFSGDYCVFAPKPPSFSKLIKWFRGKVWRSSRTPFSTYHPYPLLGFVALVRRPPLQRHKRMLTSYPLQKLRAPVAGRASGGGYPHTPDEAVEQGVAYPLQPSPLRARDGRVPPRGRLGGSPPRPRILYLRTSGT